MNPNNQINPNNQMYQNNQMNQMYQNNQMNKKNQMNKNNQMNQNIQINQNNQIYQNNQMKINNSNNKINQNNQMNLNKQMNQNNQMNINNQINSNNQIIINQQNIKNEINQNKQIINNQNNNNKESPITNIFEEEKSIIDESFSANFADAFEKELSLSKRDLNETVLEQKLKKVKERTKNTTDSFCIIDDFEIIDIKDIKVLENKEQNITIQNKKKEDYLQVRKFPIFSEKEYAKMKKNVLKNLKIIQNYLMSLRFEFNKFDPNKKIGPLIPLTYIIENNYFFRAEFKNEMQNKYEILKKYICNFRSVYRDGNCFYRAVMFRYLELLIMYRRIDILKSLTLDIYKSFQSKEIKKRLYIGKEYLKPDLIIQIMLIIIDLIENNMFLEAHLALYKSFVYCKIFDYSIILYLRYIIYSYIKQNEKKLYSEAFPVLIGTLLPSKYDNKNKYNFNSFYDNELLKMFTFAEKVIIYLTPFVLGMNLDLILFEGNEREIIKKYKYV